MNNNIFLLNLIKIFYTKILINDEKVTILYALYRKTTLGLELFQTL
ncbi:hypothetical protein UJ101_01427 [Flavobacteriaceae bacterium UJ101]|nr:hypothetical protein UJ101_01427 [Flavobacteriaceae bacterium UJ101]